MTQDIFRQTCSSQFSWHCQKTKGNWMWWVQNHQSHESYHEAPTQDHTEKKTGLTQWEFWRNTIWIQVGVWDTWCNINYAYHYREVFGKRKFLYVCFIDYAKAFDRVQHQKAFECLRNTRMDSKDMRVITNLYWNQRACIRNDNEVSDFAEIKRGVRQGCILSPSLFNSLFATLWKPVFSSSPDSY